MYVRTVLGLDEDYEVPIRRARHAIEIARADAVVSCPHTVQLLDHADEIVPVYGFGDDYPVVIAAWEWVPLCARDRPRAWTSSGTSSRAWRQHTSLRPPSR